MKTSINTWKRGNKLITVIGCSHIGTKEYYNKIQKRLNEFEDSQVLYELVIDIKNKKMKKLSKLYNKLADKIGLYNQKNGLNYSYNWKNSDLDYDTLNLVNGKDILPDKDIDLSIIDYFDTPILKFTIKFVFRFKNIVMFLKSLSKKGKKEKGATIDIRNYKCIIDIFRTLRDEDHICILYGEGHLKGIEKFLRKVGFKKYLFEKITVM